MNPCEVTTCDQCGFGRKLPEPCRCAFIARYGSLSPTYEDIAQAGQKERLT